MTSIVIAGYLRSPFQFARKGGLIKLRLLMEKNVLLLEKVF